MAGYSDRSTNCGTKSDSYEEVAPTYGEQIFSF